MKYLLPLAIALVFAACSNEKKADEANTTAPVEMNATEDANATPVEMNATDANATEANTTAN